jgi:hypothetical protein
MAKRQNGPAYLSKSLFIRGLQCHKSLYLDRYQPKLKDEVSEEKQALFESGAEVGMLARDLFPGGVEVPYKGLLPQEQLAMTASEIQKGTKTIYEAAFSHNNVFMKADILHKGRRGWELYEVKGTTKVKDVHINDVALQYHVMTGAGLAGGRTFLVHLNNQCVRQGAIEVNKLFTAEEVTAAVRSKQTVVAEEVARMRKMLRGAMPDIDIGEHCKDPYDCDFMGHCRKHIPKDSVFDLMQRGVKPFDLYREGILLLKDIPPERLSGLQLMQLKAFHARKQFVDRNAVKTFLDDLWYPLYFLDFETFMPAIPPYDGLRPYQQVPFQYSLHYLEREGAKLRHREFLAEPNVDPRAELAGRLVAEIPDDACVVVYNSSFEAKRLRELATFLPKHKKKIALILKNIKDLMVPFRKQHVYHWKMKGSASQKAVLPVLVPGLSYEGMEVADGGMAMQAYTEMCGAKNPSEVKRIRKALLEYCKLDTLGMVEIIKKLRALVR